MLTLNRQHGYRGMRLHRSMDLMATEVMPRVNKAISDPRSIGGIIESARAFPS